jgi:purine-nucleoside phosphorylase
MTESASSRRKAGTYLSENIDRDPQMGLILGSGLGELADDIEDARTFPYGEIPGFKESTVEGHAGQLVFGELEGANVCIMQGRYHYYEGHDMDDLIFPVQVMSALDMNTLLVTNASGAINRDFQVGDLVRLEDHINFMGTNPLMGPNDDDLGPRFVDMTYAYDPELGELAHDQADQLGLGLKDGVYLATTGPSYETPAEIEMFDTVGADLVGMSTVPEVIAANHCGMDVLGISCVTNMAAGVLDEPLDHEEVIETTERVKSDFKDLVRGIVANCPR